MWTSLPNSHHASFVLALLRLRLQSNLYVQVFHRIVVRGPVSCCPTWLVQRQWSMQTHVRQS